MQKVSAFAPASIGNVSLGFDLLGAALAPIDGTSLGDSVTVSPAETLTLNVSGGFAHKLPATPNDNIVLDCYHYFARAMQSIDKACPAVALHLEKRLPIGSGLGSSASSIVAAFCALNHYFDKPFTAPQLLLMMGELEGQISGSIHYDNVAPCYLGGMTLMTGDSQKPVTQLPLLDDWYWIVSYSGLSVSTAAAREILPKQYKINDVLTFGRQLGVFVDALHRKAPADAARVMHDVLAEPWRKSLLPGFDSARTATLERGGLAFGISGSGPTVFSVTDDIDKARAICDYLQQAYVQTEDGFSHICRIPPTGAAITTTTVS
ncbi:homoserine kinase [Alteromonas oceanisediminis]|uniref:homoserine kinase n=1 Tax=Alteromonas oceanisediminis TaxID=2836180 RepID=UPI001BD950F3|nr:homoserine kinase [Alteromonas oceanisediminis]MBT0585482.1 homoserine kinase [Alteromonas oceanisediminis]